MGYSRTNLSCTRPELIASGSTFNQNTNSELLEVKDGKASYRTLNGTIHHEVDELSKLHPKETFTVTWWWDEDYYHRVICTGLFNDGKYKKVKFEPSYVFFGPTVGVVEDQLIDRFKDVIMKYVNRIDIIRDDPEEGTVFDRLNDQNFFDDDFQSHFQIIWENSEHKFIGTNDFGYLIEIKYERKDPDSHVTADAPEGFNSYYNVDGLFPF